MLKWFLTNFKYFSPRYDYFVPRLSNGYKNSRQYVYLNRGAYFMTSRYAALKWWYLLALHLILGFSLTTMWYLNTGHWWLFTKIEQYKTCCRAGCTTSDVRRITDPYTRFPFLNRYPVSTELHFMYILQLKFIILFLSCI